MHKNRQQHQQLIPYDRIRDYFADQLHLPVSAGSVFNFNQEAFELLAGCENRVKAELASADVAHADETGVNIGGKGLWSIFSLNSYQL